MIITGYSHGFRMLLVPRKNSEGEVPLWGMPPTLAYPVNSDTPEVENGLLSIGGEWTTKGTVMNVIVNMLSQAFYEGQKFERTRIDAEKKAGMRTTVES